MPLGLGDDPGRRERPIRTGRRDRPVIHLPSIAMRVAVIVGIAMVLFAVVLFRLWFLQILSGGEFVAEANAHRLRSVKVVAPRGSIVDRHGKTIVENRPGLAVGIRLMDVPKGTLDGEIGRLAPVLRMRPQAIKARIKHYLRPSTLEKQSDGSWKSYLTWGKVADGEITGLDIIVLKEDVGRGLMSYLLEHDQSFPGVEIQKDYLRAYPHGDLAAHVLGHLGEISAEELTSPHFKGYQQGDVVGQDGLEWTYDKWLRGRDGVQKVEVDAAGHPTSSDKVDAAGRAAGSDPVPGGRAPAPGDTLVTTLDGKVQSAAEEALRTGISLAWKDGKTSANGGAAVVLNVKNGDVLASASYPTYDPKVWVGGISTKTFKKFNDPHANTPLLNRVVQESKAVGSTFKAIDAVGALEEGVITAATIFYCDGSFKPPDAWDKQVYPCWLPGGHGALDLTGAITESCDVYFYNVGYRFYKQKGTELQDWARRLGMGKATGIDIPGEVPGRVPTWQWKKTWPGFTTEADRVWTSGDSVNLAVGQGYLEATPLQLAVAYATIANGGHVVTPHLGLKITDQTGHTVRSLEPGAARKVDISQSTLDVVHHALYEAANSPNGTSSAVFAGYKVPVAGKTGTAEVYDASIKNNVDYAWYASYAPADDPKYAVVVMIERGGHGGIVAAPAARIIYDALFDVNSSTFSGPVQSD